MTRGHTGLRHVLVCETPCETPGTQHPLARKTRGHRNTRGHSTFGGSTFGGNGWDGWDGWGHSVFPTGARLGTWGYCTSRTICEETIAGARGEGHTRAPRGGTQHLGETPGTHHPPAHYPGTTPGTHPGDFSRGIGAGRFRGVAGGGDNPGETTLGTHHPPGGQPWGHTTRDGTGDTPPGWHHPGGWDRSRKDSRDRSLGAYQ